MISGDYFFNDNLKYEFAEWKYCVVKNHNFHIFRVMIEDFTLRCCRASNHLVQPKWPRRNITHSQYPKALMVNYLIQNFIFFSFLVRTYIYYLDVGEGYYEPIKSIIYRYDGSILRTPSEQEVENIMLKCRYNPRQSLIIYGVLFHI